MRREFVVYTDVGDYHVWAANREEAKGIVWRMTYGRAKIDFVEVHG